jgi:hypothetical protein
MFGITDILFLITILLLIFTVYEMIKKYNKKKSSNIEYNNIESNKTVIHFINKLYDHDINEYSLETFKNEYIVESGKNIPEEHKEKYYNDCISSLIVHPDININYEKNIITKKYIIRPYKIHIYGETV